MTETTDIAALREAALKATAGEWCTDSQHSVIADAGMNANYYVAACSGPDSQINASFIALANHAAIIAILDQLEAERQRDDKLESYARERDSENESIALTVGRLRLELAKLRGKLDTPIVIPPRKTAKDYVDDEFSNADLAAIYNAARLELKARIKNAGFTVKDG